jgi:hypothetical protein
MDIDIDTIVESIVESIVDPIVDPIVVSMSSLSCDQTHGSRKRPRSNEEDDTMTSTSLRKRRSVNPLKSLAIPNPPLVLDVPIPNDHDSSAFGIAAVDDFPIVYEY